MGGSCHKATPLLFETYILNNIITKFFGKTIDRHFKILYHLNNNDIVFCHQVVKDMTPGYDYIIFI